MNIDKIVYCLKEQGFYIINDYFNPTKVLGEVRQILKSSGDESYEFGKSARIGNVKLHKNKNPAIYELFSAGWMEEVSRQYLECDIDFNENIFITHDFRNDKGLARNGYLHFDRQRALKFFAYLLDCSYNSGPLTLCPGTHKIGKTLRKQAWKEKTYDDVKNRIELDYKDLDYSAPIPICAAAGTMIIFDTDTFHKGGEVSDGFERMIIRAHTRILKR